MTAGQREQHAAHEWVRDEARGGIQAWACAECDATCATCGTCRKASGTSLLLCQRCEKAEAAVLSDIGHALELWQASPKSPMRSPGNMRLVRGGQPGGITSPADVEARLWSWVARWSEFVGADNAGPLDYLRSRHMWAAHNPEASDWDDYRKATRKLRAEARRIAGLLPQRLPEPCVLCGGAVVQDWADKAWMPHEDGLSDTVRCTRCGTTWGDRTHWRFTQRQRIVELPGVRPDALVTLAHARRLWPEVPAATWRSWAKRWREEGEDAIERARYWWDLRCAFLAGPNAWPAFAGPDWQGPGEAPSVPGWMPERGERDGQATYRVGDLHALVVRRAHEGRQGRPVGEKVGA